MNLRCLFRVLCLFTVRNLGKDFEEHSHDMPSCQVVATFPIRNLRKNAFVCQWVGLSEAHLRHLRPVFSLISFHTDHLHHTSIVQHS